MIFGINFKEFFYYKPDVTIYFENKIYKGAIATFLMDY